MLGGEHSCSQMEFVFIRGGEDFCTSIRKHQRMRSRLPAWFVLCLLANFWGCAHFPEILQNCVACQIFCENVLDSFSCFYIEIVYLNITFCCASRGTSGGGGEKHEIYAGGHLFDDLFFPGPSWAMVPSPLPPPPPICYCAPTGSVFRCATQFQQNEHTPV